MTSLQDYSDENNDTDLIQGLIVLDSLTIDGTTVDVATKAHDTIWRMYRYAMLNCRSTEKYIKRWKQRFSDISGNISERYNVLFKAYETYKADGSLISIDSVNTIHVEGNSTDASTDESESTNENIPQYSGASAETWLSNRTKGTGSSNGSASSTQDTTMKGINGYLPSELVARLRTNSWNPYEDYAGEFRSLFVPFYVDECGCSDYGCD